MSKSKNLYSRAQIYLLFILILLGVSKANGDDISFLNDLELIETYKADFIQKSVEDRTKAHKKSIIKLENNSTVKQYSKSNKDFGNLSYNEFLIRK